MIGVRLQGQLTGNCLRMTLREKRTRVKDGLVGIQCEVEPSNINHGMTTVRLSDSDDNFEKKHETTNFPGSMCRHASSVSFIPLDIDDPSK